MPKRRTPKQKAASRRNLEKARAVRKREALNAQVLRDQPGKLVPHGKTRLLYHHTTPSKAAKILKTGFKAGGTGRSKDSVYFSTKKGDMAGAYGKTVLSVKVPRKLARRNELFHKTGEEWMVVKPKALTGRKVKRVK